MNIIKLINATDVFGQFAQTKISSKLAYKIMKFCKAVGVEQEFYNKKRQEIIDMYSLKDANGQIVISDDNTIRIMPDKINEANAAMQELNNLEVDIPDIKFTLDELNSLELSIADMFALDAFVEE